MCVKLKGNLFIKYRYLYNYVYNKTVTVYKLLTQKYECMFALRNEQTVH